MGSRIAPAAAKPRRTATTQLVMLTSGLWLLRILWLDDDISVVRRIRRQRFLDGRFTGWPVGAPLLLGDLAPRSYIELLWNAVPPAGGRNRSLHHTDRVHEL